MKKNKYLPNFGLEIHVELLTQTKAFSSSLRNWSSKPNTNLDEIVLGYPGAKPIINLKMVELAYRTALSFNMHITEIIRFERKNYFYPDLAKSYQITQHSNPFATNGIFTILYDNGTEKDIHISEIHMEEDTAKQIIEIDKIKFDYNRSGNPLVEIVTGHHDFTSIEDVCIFVEQLREQLKINKINSGVLAEGAFRVDVNVSVRRRNYKKIGTKVEIKNLNSIKNIKKALEYEIAEQIKSLKNKQKILYSTKRFDEELGETILIREKSKNANYNFINEGNILPIKLDQNLIAKFEQEEIIIVNNVRKQLLGLKIPLSQIKAILSSNDFFMIYQNLSDKFDQKKLIAILTSSFLEAYKPRRIDYHKLNLEQLLDIIKLFYQKKLNNIEVKRFFISLLEQIDLQVEINDLKELKLLTKTEISKLVRQLIKDNGKIIIKYKNRIDKNKSFLMGQLMKITKGKIDPEFAEQIIINNLKDL